MTEDQLDKLLFGRRESAEPERPLPDFGNIHEQLRTHKHLTLQLLWDEYRQAQPDGYGYPRYVATEFMLRGDLRAMTNAVTGHNLPRLYCHDILRCVRHIPGPTPSAAVAGERVRTG